MRKLFGLLLIVLLASAAHAQHATTITPQPLPPSAVPPGYVLTFDDGLHVADRHFDQCNSLYAGHQLVQRHRAVLHVTKRHWTTWGRCIQPICGIAPPSRTLVPLILMPLTLTAVDWISTLRLRIAYGIPAHANRWD